MRVLQVPFNYYPEPVGGTEVYVASLTQELRAAGVDVEVAAVGHCFENYVYEDVPVHRFGHGGAPADLAVIYGAGDPVAADQFLRIVDSTAPDLVHLHAMTPAVSLSVLRRIKARGIPVVFTCHIPGILCPRATLLRNGVDVCDGIWGLHKCSSCSAQGKGVPVPLARVLGAVPQVVGRGLGRLDWRGPVATALRMTDLQQRRRAALEEFLDLTDRVVAVAAWLRDMLAANGVSGQKLHLCRHGSTRCGPSLRSAPDAAPGPLKLAYLGRLDPTKGPQVVVEAVRRRPQIPVQLDIYGIVQDAPQYANHLRRLAGGDTRIRFLKPVPNEQVLQLLRDYDALVVPSLWLETGPLVVYDAFDAGIPVLGSDRGGIAELVRHDRDGLLIEPGNPESWARCFETLLGEPHLLPRLRAGVTPGRGMDAVAAEMIRLYGDVVPAPAAAVAAPVAP
jgi:glycosyltransferase involved in cell wall biosynthesis